MPLLFRYATIEDAEAVHSIIQAAFAEYVGKILVPPGALSETLEETRHAIAEGHTLLAFTGPGPNLSFDGNRIFSQDGRSLAEATAAGFPTVVGTVRYETRPDCLYVGRLAVLSEYRREGIGAKLMRELESVAPHLGLTRLRLGTRASMPSNLAFYERLGYSVVERKQHERGPDTVLWFEKELAGVDTPASMVQGLAADVESLLGKVLEGVIYWCFETELVPSELDVPFVSIGSEIELRFHDAAPVFISWRSIKGWSGYIVELANESHFVPGSVQAFDARGTGIWKPLIGERLVAAELLGWGGEGMPYIIKLIFPTGVVYVGNGYQHMFTDGDDTLICSEIGRQQADDGDKTEVLARLVEGTAALEGYWSP